MDNMKRVYDALQETERLMREELLTPAEWDQIDDLMSKLFLIPDPHERL